MKRNNDGLFSTYIGGSKSCMGYVDIIDGNPQCYTINTLSHATYCGFALGLPNDDWESFKVRQLLDKYIESYISKD
jgi:hypothetical protein